VRRSGQHPEVGARCGELGVGEVPPRHQEILAPPARSWACVASSSATAHSRSNSAATSGARHARIALGSAGPGPLRAEGAAGDATPTAYFSTHERVEPPDGPAGVLPDARPSPNQGRPLGMPAVAFDEVNSL
jgi:hypothetical protein